MVARTSIRVEVRVRVESCVVCLVKWPAHHAEPVSYPVAIPPMGESRRRFVYLQQPQLLGVSGLLQQVDRNKVAECYFQECSGESMLKDIYSTWNSR